MTDPTPSAESDAGADGGEESLCACPPPWNNDHTPSPLCPVHATCQCGHVAIDHHGTDPSEGCLGVISHRLPACACALTCAEVLKVVDAGQNPNETVTQLPGGVS